MATTPNSALRFPVGSDAVNVATYFSNLASDLDQKVIVRVADYTSRNALTKYDGMMVRVASDRRFWLWNSTTAAWDYAGGQPPPISAVTVQSGWTALAGHAPGVYKDSSGLVHFVGAVTNNLSYNPNAALASVCQLPAGFFNSNAFVTGSISLGAGAGTPISFQISTTGMLQVSGSTSSSIGAASGHWLEMAAPFHTGYAGTVPLA